VPRRREEEQGWENNKMLRVSRSTTLRFTVLGLAPFGVVGLTWAQLAQAPAAAPASAAAASWTWSPFLDAVQAAPKSHRVLIDNERVRVLEVVVQPGQKEPIHTHQWPSVMYVTNPASLRYYSATLVNGKWVEKGDDSTPPATPPNPNRPRPPQYLEPEGPHAVENMGTTPYRALRVEIKTP
jgi:hypothetical protein